MNAQINLRVMADVCAGGLWDDEGECALASHFPESSETEALEERLYQWNRKYDASDTEPAVPNPRFDWDSWHKEGFELARDIKRFVGERATVTFVYGYEWPGRDPENDEIEIK